MSARTTRNSNFTTTPYIIRGKGAFSDQIMSSLERETDETESWNSRNTYGVSLGNLKADQG